MDFFEQQDRSRRHTRWLIGLFALALVSIVLAVNAVVLIAMGVSAGQAGERSLQGRFSADMIGQNWDLILWTTLITVGGVFLASAYRTSALRNGGGVVARELGGTRVEPDTADPLRQRLRNVVEEMAVASGVPVPEIYVLENEGGINAFAAGYSTSDAAIAVTQGTLERLDRAELQGVIAHEFSHILNGDMRLNIRLIGLLFGILVLSVVGSRVMLIMGSGRRSRNAGAAVVVGLALVAIGYIGVFFGRCIQAAVSRRREYLADASAVQFTRQPEGIAGALKKIGATQMGSHLVADSEEVGHMLFARGFAANLFATHPPVVKRIQAIEPQFDPSELQQVHERMARHAQARQAAVENPTRSETANRRHAAGPGGMPIDADSITRGMGQPQLAQLLAAAALTSALPDPLRNAARSVEWAPEVICYLLMDPDHAVRENQLLSITRHLGADSERQVTYLLQAAPELPAEQRLALLELAFPALRRRPRQELLALPELIDELIAADGVTEVFEYALGRLLRKQIEETLHPADSRGSGRATIEGHQASSQTLLAIVARRGSRDEAVARTAYAAGTEALGMSDAAMPEKRSDWPRRLDRALTELDALRMQDKRRLMTALVATISEDGKTTPAERELLRVVCACLHLPLPVTNEAQHNRGN